MIRLKHGRFISGARVFRAGEILPDIAGVQELVARGLAEVIAEVKAAAAPKPAKKREAPTPVPEAAPPAQENVEGNP